MVHLGDREAGRVDHDQTSTNGETREQQVGEQASHGRLVVDLISLDGGQRFQAVAQPLRRVAHRGDALERLTVPDTGEQGQPHHDAKDSSGEDGSRQTIGGFHGVGVAVVQYTMGRGTAVDAPWVLRE